MSQSLESVYREHRQGFYSLAVSITRSRQLAEDAVHEAFVKLVDRELPVGDLTAYVYRTVRNAAIDSTRASIRRRNLAGSLFNGYRPSGDVSDSCPGNVALTQERDQILRQAIDELPEPQRETVILKSFGGLTFDQASQIMQVPAKTVATRYRRALKKLETRLKGQL